MNNLQFSIDQSVEDIVSELGEIFAIKYSLDRLIPVSVIVRDNAAPLLIITQLETPFLYIDPKELKHTNQIKENIIKALKSLGFNS